MLTLSQDYSDTINSESELQVYAKWWTKNTFPVSIEEVGIDDVFEVKNVLDRGEYYDRPLDATGVIVVTQAKLAAVAAWRNKEHKGPWQVYGEQEANTVAFHFLGDTEVVFIGWV